MINKLKLDKIINCPVFVYHHIKDLDDDMDFATTVEMFENNLITLLENSYNSISLKKYFNYINDDNQELKNYFVITFDDGYESNYTLAYPVLKKLNVFADIFIITSLVGFRSHPSFTKFIPHFSWAQAREMERSGLISIQSHGDQHIPNDTMSEHELSDSIKTSLNKIKNNLDNKDFIAYGYPHGKCNKNIIQLVNTFGFQMQMINEANITADNVEKGCINRIDVNYHSNLLNQVDTFKKNLRDKLITL